MDPTWIWIVAALLGVALLAFALTRRARGRAPQGRRPDGAVERFWDTQEHSDAWDEEERRGRPGPHERPRT